MDQEVKTPSLLAKGGRVSERGGAFLQAFQDASSLEKERVTSGRQKELGSMGTERLHH